VSAAEHRLLLPALVARDRIVALLSAPGSTYPINVALALAEEAIGCIEVTLTTAEPWSPSRPCGHDVTVTPARVGAGSALTVGDLEAAHSAGATYTHSPPLSTST